MVKEKQSLLLRVGADIGTNEMVLPFLHNETWVYIPIMDQPTHFPHTYDEIFNSNFKDNHRLSHFLPNYQKNEKPHYDPEFWNFTYGEPLKDGGKYSQLKRLGKGDYLLFHAGMYSLNKNEVPLKHWVSTRIVEHYLIGYFVVEKLIEFESTKIQTDKKFKLGVELNAHFLRKEEESCFVIFGSPNQSKLLKFPLKITKNGDNVSPMNLIKELKNRGLEKISRRSGSGNWVPVEALDWTLSQVKNDPGYSHPFSKEELQDVIYKNKNYH
ncbi:MAG: hypothetical protein HeimC2_27630 [Candidatus Heimdallarchaeota archaeon LC_2]|nr:MAG: hypothetical protein HeimC2_27630 [Candidatus Heimdallarchaeota archaeon LC_2]